MFARYMVLCTLCIVFLMTSSLALAQSGVLANPGFEDGPLGIFGDVVSPSFTPGFWGDEGGVLVSGAGGATPRTGTYMLRMIDAGGTTTETWQVIDVEPGIGLSISVSGWFNAYDGVAPRGIINVRTFDATGDWQSPTSVQSVSEYLDSSATTWEKVSMDCFLIPDDTEWVLIDLQFPCAEVGGWGGYVDDVEFFFDCEGVPIESSSWGNVKALYRD